MPTALVTGGTGFLGAWVARYLVEAGYQVRILRRQTSKLTALGDLQVEHVIGDLDDLESLAKAVKGVDYVFHIAAIAAYWRNDKDSIYRANVDGTRNLLLVAERAKVKRFIFTSSAAAVGWRDDGYPADENTYFNLDPRLSPYAHSKFLAEAEVYQAIQRGLDTVILNPTVIIGPGDLNLISGSLVLEIARGQVPFMPMQGGVTLIDVRDVAHSHLAALEKGHTGERYILGTVNLSHRALMNLIARVVRQPAPHIPTPAPIVDLVAGWVDVGRKLNIKIPGDAEGNQLRMSKHNIYFDCGKAWRELHEPQIDIYESILDTYQWYKLQGVI